MPCTSEYQDPTQLEQELSRVYGLLEELDTGKLPDDYGNGWNSKVYNKGFTQKHLDEKTEWLCAKLQQEDVKKYSLEMQIWWRDHQKADKKRIQKELEKEKTKETKKKALAKLTPYERKLLEL